jgi:hypothetical protein
VNLGDAPWWLKEALVRWGCWMRGVPIEQIRRHVRKYVQLNLYIKNLGLSLADDAQFHGCHFSPGRAKNDIQ